MKIMIDPGHGGADPGAVAPSGDTEKDLVLHYASVLSAHLMNRRHTVLTTRNQDVFVPLGVRASMANTAKADVFVSIHANAADSKLANGAWVIYDDMSKPEHGKALATAVFEELAKIPNLTDKDSAAEVFPDRSGAVGGRNLAVLSQTQMPAILIELGFMTNEEDLFQLKQLGAVDSVAAAITRGIERWAGIVVVQLVDLAVLTLEQRVYRLEKKVGLV